MLKLYPGQVKLVFKNFPLRSHKFALPAAMAALAAGQQGKFWEFHDALFKNHNQLSDKKILAIARSLKLDEARFDKQRKSRAIFNRIKTDYNEALRLGIRGVPTVFINGRQLKNHSPAEIKKAIDKELAVHAKK